MRIIVTFSLLLMCENLYACEKLLGTWVSSMELSYEYAKSLKNIEPKKLEFIRQAFGHMKVTYTNDTLVVHKTKEIDVTIDAKNYPFGFDASESAVKYKICNSDSVEVEYVGENVVNTNFVVHFIDGDTYWVNPAGTRYREYFVRYKLNKSSHSPH